jgi:hypothetical protein
VDGVVVMHGTDTIEETAYLLDRSLPAGVPVVITGAMRNSASCRGTAPANLMKRGGGGREPEARGRGTKVVMDEEIVQGAEVVKDPHRGGRHLSLSQLGAAGDHGPRARPLLPRAAASRRSSRSRP